MCAPCANTYSREWFYINLYWKKSSAELRARLWKCNCRTCTSARLFHLLFVKQTREVEWAQVGLLLRLGMRRPFAQLIKMLTSIASKRNGIKS
ncbi:MAG: hypothetical protein ACTS5F_00475 [Candidatus Hodgkinia cicadicola]